MADEPSSSDNAGDQDDPLKALGGFLSEPTRRVRRALLAVSVGAIAVVDLKPKVDTVMVFGNPVTIADRQWLVTLGEGVLLYFMLAFAVYATGDYLRARASITRAIQPTGPPGWPAMTRLLLMVLRIFLDLAVPFAVGMYELIRWK
jgi:hypothetical protein